MEKSIFIFVKIYVILFYLGFGLTQLLLATSFKKEDNERLLLLGLTPLVGIITLLSLSTLTLGAGVSLTYSTYIVLLISTVTLILSIRKLINGPNNIGLNLKLCKTYALSLGGLFATIPLIYLLTLNTGSLFDVRLGVDAGLYLDAARSLYENDYIKINDTEFSVAAFEIHLRWGMPIIIAFLAKLTNDPGLWKTASSLTILVMPLIAIGVSSLLYIIAKVNWKIAFIGGVLISFNSNLLFLLSEAQWPHLIYIMLLVILMTVFEIILNSSKIFSIDNIKLFIFAFLTSAASIVIFSEGIPLTLLLILSIVITEIFIYHNLKGGINRGLLGILVIVSSLIIILPYSYKIIYHLLNLNIGAAGYPLPLKALPSEIAGIGDIYSRWKEWLIPESSIIKIPRKNLGLTVFLSILCITYWYKGVPLLAKKSRPLWIGAVFVYVAGIAFFWIFKKNSYSYMKVYAAMLPFIFIPVWVGIYSNPLIFKNLNFKFLNATKKFVLTAFAVTTIIIGIKYLVAHRQSSIQISDYDREMGHSLKLISPDCVITFKPRGYPLPYLRYVDRTFEIVATANLTGLYVIDSWDYNLINFPIKPNRDEYKLKNICVAIDKFSVIEWKKLNSIPNKVIFSNPRWIVFQTTYKIEDLIKKFKGDSLKLLGPS